MFRTNKTYVTVDLQAGSSSSSGQDSEPTSDGDATAASDTTERLQQKTVHSMKRHPSIQIPIVLTVLTNSSGFNSDSDSALTLDLSSSPIQERIRNSSSIQIQINVGGFDLT